MTDATTRGRRPGVDRMQTKQTGARTGSRPKPPEAGAQSASLEPGRAPGYSSNKNHSCSPAARERADSEPRQPSPSLTHL